MRILTWIIFGLIAGAIAKLIMPGTQGGGWLMTIILGIVGAFVGGFIGSFLGWGTTDSFDFRSMLLAVGGALIVLWIYGMATRKG
ncbi:MAG: GlsB/YeaQ/YmgE family stress response membrane protein [Chryseobacterium sp.]